MTSTGTCCTILTSALECVVNVVQAARNSHAMGRRCVVVAKSRHTSSKDVVKHEAVQTLPQIPTFLVGAKAQAIASVDNARDCGFAFAVTRSTGLHEVLTMYDSNKTRQNVLVPAVSVKRFHFALWKST